jgi:hypothetical protein
VISGNIGNPFGPASRASFLKRRGGASGPDRGRGEATRATVHADAPRLGRYWSRRGDAISGSFGAREKLTVMLCTT